ncbi:hypothetical protein FSP39_012084 [Pinctada imbricata]|uniref:CCHC-type domain-containing protein n=1 Tax=Pinctada imbricata TaxID=66713 RepID=A0AA88Y493_PINIB|nr:hypothetical protein FSP39_012084 [Pinctada imbricata]
MTDFSEDELQAIAAALKEMKVKPKADSASDLKQWMVDYVTQMKSDGTTPVQVKQEADTGNGKADGGSKVVTTHIPKISCFSGDGSKQDTSYDLWRYEVDCLIKEKYSEGVIAQSIRRSLRGDAGKVAMRLGPQAKVQEILDKMHSIFGTVERGETILEEFYSATQKKDETSMAWSCRLEEIFRKAIEKGAMNRNDANEKLKSRFWNGLHQWLKDISGYKYDTISDFDDLRKEVLLMEKEHSSKKTNTNMVISATGATGQSDEMKELKGMIQQLTAKVTKLERGNQKDIEPNRGRQQYETNFDGRRYTSTQQQQRGNRQRGQQNFRGGYQQNISGGYQQNFSGGYQQPYHPYYENNYDSTQEPLCYRCGQPGHLALGCRVILDHRRKPLNYDRPASKGTR